MSVFYHEEQPNRSKRCKYLAAALKDAFSHCHTSNGRVLTPSPEEYPTSDFDEDEQEVVVSAIRSRAMEKLRRKPGLLSDGFSWVFSSSTEELYITPKEVQHSDNEREEFFSVGSCFSRCSSAPSREAFLSVESNFSRCSSLNGFDYQDFKRFDFQHFGRRSIIREFCHCEGWPFGLCRKAVLLPPLPKSPSESWSWRKRTRIAKMPYI